MFGRPSCHCSEGIYGSLGTPTDERQETAVHILLNIDKAIGGDRPTMELWFNRAMKANGDQDSSCFTKLDWLDPKWYGTPEEMVAFGRACRDTKNWYAGITLLVADAHNRFTNHMSPEDRKTYLSRADVWADIQSVFDEYLKHHPSNDVVRSKYASMGYMAGHYYVGAKFAQLL